jgi:hypothetical protein
MKNYNPGKQAVCLPLIFLFTIALHSQSVHYVDRYAVGANDGSSWTNAYLNLHTALAVAEYGDEVWVAEGTYFPTETNDRDISFELPLGVKLYGSFKGTENSPEERDLENLETILSGAIGGDTLEDNSRTILHVTRADSNNLVDGFTIQHGYALLQDNSVSILSRERSGAGIYITIPPAGMTNNLLIKNTDFINNHSPFGWGGGIYARQQCGVLLENCNFSYNKANNGGAVALNEGSYQSTIPDIKSCDFSFNEANFGAGVYLITNHHQQDLWIEQTVFHRNKAVADGGGISIREGRRLKSLLIKDCHFSENGENDSNSTGAGISLQVILTGSMDSVREINVLDCVFDNNWSAQGSAFSTYLILKNTRLLFSHCIFRHTLSGESYTSITSDIGTTYLEPDSDLTISNCLWINTGDLQNTFIRSSQSEPGSLIRIRQSTFFDAGNWDTNQINDFHSFLDAGKDCHIDNSIFVSPSKRLLYRPSNPFIDFDTTYINIRHSIFQNVPTCSDLILSDLQQISCEPGVLFNTNPLFTDPDNDDFTLLPGSPAIDAGANFILSSEDSLDLNGLPRMINDIVDMGAYEWQGPTFSVALDSVQHASCPNSEDAAVFFNLVGQAPFFVN